MLLYIEDCSINLKCDVCKARRGFLPFTRPLEGRRWSPEAAAHFFRILTEMAGTIVAQVIHSLSSHTAAALVETFSIVADPDLGFVAFLTTGPGIRNRFFLDPGSRIAYLGQFG